LLEALFSVINTIYGVEPDMHLPPSGVEVKDAGAILSLLSYVSLA
jgi:hypothetical protein